MSNSGALIVLVNRGDEFPVPSGGTVLEAGDKLSVLTDKGELSGIRAKLQAEQPPYPPPNAAE